MLDDGFTENVLTKKFLLLISNLFWKHKKNTKTENKTW